MSIKHSGVILTKVRIPLSIGTRPETKAGC